MNTDRFCRSLEKHGFQKVNLNLPQHILYYKEEREQSVYLVLIWQMEENVMPYEQYNNIKRQIKTNFYQQYEDVFLLNILYTNHVEQGKELCEEWDENWLFHMEEQKLIIYENQSGKFLNVRELFEESLKPFDFYSLPFVTLSIIAINIIIFILAEVTGGTLDTQHMYEWGAMYWPSVVKEGQIHRLITSMFLHFGIEHLGNNMIVLGFIGSLLERLMGRKRYFILYFTSGILAGAASMGYNILYGRAPVAAGASGAIFGILGAMVYIVAINKGRVEDVTIGRLLFSAGITLFSGFTNQGIDNMAHIGGFLSGFILSVILYRRKANHNQKGGEKHR